MSKLFKYYNQETEFEKVWYESSNIKYSEIEDTDTAQKILRVVFNTKVMYEYKDVDVYDYLKFRDAESQGKAFNQYIRKYECKKIGETDMSAIQDELMFRTNKGFELKYSADGLKIFNNNGTVVFEKEGEIEPENKQMINDILSAVGVIYKEV